jgi:hypothetical protein
VSSVLLSLVLTLLPAGSGDELNVRPAPNEAQLTLEGKRVNRPTNSPAQPINNPTPGRAGEPAYTPLVSCKTNAEIGIYGCRTDRAEPDDEDADEPELTPGDVLRAVREIGLPSLQVKVQPGTDTLVNIETIFYAEPQPFERSVRLLDFDVDVVAEPVSYQWIHGDGTTATTTTPGRPYPSMDVVHRYTAASDSVAARVDVTYRVRFRVDGGPWQTIGRTLLAPGQPTILDVDEAAPVLTRP